MSIYNSWQQISLEKNIRQHHFKEYRSVVAFREKGQFPWKFLDINCPIALMEFSKDKYKWSLAVQRTYNRIFALLQASNYCDISDFHVLLRFLNSNVAISVFFFMVTKCAYIGYSDRGITEFRVFIL